MKDTTDKREISYLITDEVIDIVKLRVLFLHIDGKIT